MSNVWKSNSKGRSLGYLDLTDTYLRVLELGATNLGTFMRLSTNQDEWEDEGTIMRSAILKVGGGVILREPNSDGEDYHTWNNVHQRRLISRRME